MNSEDGASNGMCYIHTYIISFSFESVYPLHISNASLIYAAYNMYRCEINLLQISMIMTYGNLPCSAIVWSEHG